MHFLVLLILLTSIINGVETQNMTLVQNLTLTQSQNQNYMTLAQMTQLDISNEINGTVEEIINAVASVEMDNSTQPASSDLIGAFSSLAEIVNGLDTV